MRLVAEITDKRIPTDPPKPAYVLVVDDDPEQRELAVRRLEKRGLNVAGASDWTSMNDFLYRNLVGVLLLDVNLPGLKGDQLVDILRRNFRPGPEIVYFSAMDGGSLRALARESGVHYYVQKGSSASALELAVRGAMRDFQLARAG